MFKRIINNWGIKLLCLIIALVFYSSFHYLSFHQRHLNIPITVKLPENLKTISNVPNSIKINIKGSQSLLYLVDPLKIEAVADFSFVNTPGIYSTKINLNYDNGVFQDTNLVITPYPITCKIAFDRV